MADTALIFSIIAKDKSKAGFDKVKVAAGAAAFAIGAALKSGIEMTIEKSKLDQTLAAQLGASPAQAAEIGKLSGKVYAENFGEDLPAVNNAIKSAVQNGLVSVKDLGSQAAKSITENLLTVSQVVGEETGKVSAAVANMVRTGMVKSTQEGMDLIVKSTQMGINKNEDLLDTLNEYSTQFRKLGINGQTAMGLVNQAMKGGARDSDLAADALKEFSIRSVDGSKLSAQGYKTLGLDAKKMTKIMAKGGDQAGEGLGVVLDKLRAIKDPVKQSAAATALFGSQAEDLGKALFSMNVDTASDSMTGIKGATDAAAKTAAAGASSYATLGRQFQMALVDTLNKALPAVNAVFGFMEKHSNWVKPLAVGIAALAVALGIITAVQWAWNAALALSPVTWIILGIIALVAIIVIVATKTKFFQTIWGAVWGFMKTVGAWFAGPFAGFFVSTWHKITASFSRAKSQLMSIINGIKGFFVGMWNGFNSVNNKISGGVNKLISWFVHLPGRIAGSLKGVFNGLWNGFKINVNRIIAGWNGLSFGLPGFSFAGISVPGMSIGTPNLPYLAKGGTVQSQGLAYIHRGETVTPAARVTPYRSTSGNGGATITLKGDGTRLMNLLLEILREAIRDKGGDPVKVLTPR